jgi:hypothetical protein
MTVAELQTGVLAYLARYLWRRALRLGAWTLTSAQNASRDNILAQSCD